MEKTHRISSWSRFGLLTGMVTCLGLASTASQAQICVDDATYATAMGTETGSIDTLNGLATSLNTLVAASTVAVSTALTTASATNSSNTSLLASVHGKGVDHTMSAGWNQDQMRVQGDEINNFATTTPAEQYNLCQHINVVSGVSAATNAALNTLAGMSAAGNGTGGGGAQGNNLPIPASCPNGTACPPTIKDEFNPTASSPARVANLAKMAQNEFATTNSEGQTGTGGANNISAPGADVDVVGYISTMDPNATGNPTQSQAVPNLTFQPGYIDGYAQYMKYIAGNPPQNPSKDTTFRGQPQGATAVVAQREKIAFQNTAILPFAEFFADHMPTNSGGAGAVTDIFAKAGITIVSGAGVSKAMLENAMYVQPAENPDIHLNLVGMGSDQELAFIASEILALNRLEYERYQVEQGIWQATSAQLALQVRTTDFAAAP